MFRARSPSPAGFSLIEVIMATAVLLVGFVGIIQTVTFGSESLDTARKQQVAQQIITAEIEKLRGGAWSTIAGLPGSAAIAISPAGVISGDTTQFALSGRTTAASDDQVELSGLARGFRCSFVREYLRPVAASAATVTYLKLTYTVTWTSNTGRPHHHSVDTYLGKNGLHLSFQQS